MGKKDGSYCWNVGMGGKMPMPYSAVRKTECEQFYVDPILRYTEGYEFDCSLGCTPCVYEPAPNDPVNYRCTKGPITTGCP